MPLLVSISTSGSCSGDASPLDEEEDGSCFSDLIVAATKECTSQVSASIWLYFLLLYYLKKLIASLLEVSLIATMYSFGWVPLNTRTLHIDRWNGSMNSQNSTMCICVGTRGQHTYWDANGRVSTVLTTGCSSMCPW